MFKIQTPKYLKKKKKKIPRVNEPKRTPTVQIQICNLKFKLVTCLCINKADKFNLTTFKLIKVYTELLFLI